jgi:hypothetical protein
MLENVNFIKWEVMESAIVRYFYLRDFKLVTQLYYIKEVGKRQDRQEFYKKYTNVLVQNEKNCDTSSKNILILLVKLKQTKKGEKKKGEKEGCCIGVFFIVKNKTNINFIT